MMTMNSSTLLRTLIHTRESASVVFYICMSLMIAFTATGCGGKKLAQTELDQAVISLEALRKSNCDHESSPLAEDAFARAQAYFQQEKYSEARAQARLAKQYAKEAQQANGGQPCNVEQKTKVDPAIDGQVAGAVDLAQPFEPQDLSEMEVIYFKYDSSTLSESAIEAIEKNIDWMQKHQTARISIGGHCDARGGQEYNLALSERRARAVEGYLKNRGIKAERLEVVGYGSEEIKAFGSDASSHQKNRRVEFDLAK